MRVPMNGRTPEGIGILVVPVRLDREDRRHMPAGSGFAPLPSIPLPRLTCGVLPLRVGHASHRHTLFGRVSVIGADEEVEILLPRVQVDAKVAIATGKVVILGFAEQRVRRSLKNKTEILPRGPVIVGKRCADSGRGQSFASRTYGVRLVVVPAVQRSVIVLVSGLDPPSPVCLVLILGQDCLTEIKHAVP